MNPEHIIKRPIALTEKAARLKEQNKGRSCGWGDAG